MANYSVLTVTTVEGTRTFKVGTRSSIVVSSPGPRAIRSGGAFSGFAQRFPDGVNDGGAVVYPATRVKQLAYAAGGGNAQSPDLVTVTLAGGDGGPGAWTKTATVPVNVSGGLPVPPAGSDYTAVDPDSELAVVDAIADADKPGQHTKTISLRGLSAISVTEAS